MDPVRVSTWLILPVRYVVWLPQRFRNENADAACATAGVLTTMLRSAGRASPDGLLDLEPERIFVAR
jgi:hypothetical protein